MVGPGYVTRSSPGAGGPADHIPPPTHHTRQDTQHTASTTSGHHQELSSKDMPGRHSILSMLGIIFDESVAET